MASVIPSAPLGTDVAESLAGPGAASEAGSSRALPERRFRFEPAAHPGTPAQAGRPAWARLTGWSVRGLRENDDLVRVAVRDEGCASGRPRVARQRPQEEHGRGLPPVDAPGHARGAHQPGPELVVRAGPPRTAGAPPDPSGPRNDLGWGARPKPGPSGGRDEADDAETSEGSGSSGRAGAGPGSGERRVHREAGTGWL
ncbi:hypothetical protein SUDANB6_04516 [Streptomyces sp. enrichment culture]